MSWMDMEFAGRSCASVLSVGGRHMTPHIETKFSLNEEVRGYATKFKTLHVYNGKLDYFEPGCFARSLAGKAAIRLLADHDESKLIATTADRLQLHADDNGLAFRCSLAGLDPDVREMIGTRRAMSIGYSVLDSKEHEIEGCQVRVIRDGDLREISICHRGAVREAFAILGEETDAQTLRELCKSSALLLDGAGNAVMAALKTLRERFSA